MGNRFLGIVNEANTQGTNVDDFLSENEYARDDLVNSLAASNSHLRKLAQGRSLRSRRGDDGRFYVEAQEGEGQWGAAVGEDGKAFSFSPDELTYTARLDSFSAGRAELIRIDHETQQRVQSGELSEDEGEAVRLELSKLNTEMMTKARDAGIPPEEIIERQAQGAAAEGESEDPAPTDDNSVVLDDAGNPMDIGSIGWRGSLLKRPYTITAKDIENQRAKNSESEDAEGDGLYEGYLDRYTASGVQINEGDSTAEKVGKSFSNEMRGQYNSVAAPVLATAATGVDKGLGYLGDLASGAGEALNGVLGIDTANSEPSSTASQSAPQSRSAKMYTAPVPEGSLKPTQVRAKTNQSVRKIEQYMRQPTDTGSRVAAANYANAMFANGVNPSPVILANLEAGDNMRGDGLKALEMELGWAKLLQKGSQEKRDQVKARRNTNDGHIKNLGKAVADLNPNVESGDAAWAVEHSLAMVSPLAHRYYGQKGGPREWDEPALLAVGESIRKAMVLHGKEAGGFMGMFKTRIDARGKAHKSVIPPEIRGMIQLDGLRTSDPDEYSRMLSQHGGEKGASLALGSKNYNNAGDFE
ncbi:MAG: hypothetical protein ACRBBW_20545 [Cellvibrionaceae bacterium]